MTHTHYFVLRGGRSDQAACGERPADGSAINVTLDLAMVDCPACRALILQETRRVSDTWGSVQTTLGARFMQSRHASLRLTWLLVVRPLVARGRRVVNSGQHLYQALRRLW